MLLLLRTNITNGTYHDSNNSCTCTQMYWCELLWTFVIILKHIFNYVLFTQNTLNRRPDIESTHVHIYLYALHTFFAENCFVAKTCWYLECDVVCVCVHKNCSWASRHSDIIITIIKSLWLHKNLKWYDRNEHTL